MTAPAETATEALADAYLDEVKGDEDHHHEAAAAGARAVLASLAQHRDDIARVIQSCDANSETWDDLPGYAREAFRRRADAVLAYLTGEAP